MAAGRGDVVPRTQVCHGHGSCQHVRRCQLSERLRGGSALVVAQLVDPQDDRRRRLGAVGVPGDTQRDDGGRTVGGLHSTSCSPSSSTRVMSPSSPMASTDPIISSSLSPGRGCASRSSTTCPEPSRTTTDAGRSSELTNIIHCPGFDLVRRFSRHLLAVPDPVDKAR